MLIGLPREQEGASPFLPPGSQLPTSTHISRDREGAAGKATQQFSEAQPQHHKAGDGKMGLEQRGRSLLTTRWHSKSLFPSHLFVCFII